MDSKILQSCNKMAKELHEGDVYEGNCLTEVMHFIFSEICLQWKNPVLNPALN